MKEPLNFLIASWNNAYQLALRTCYPEHIQDEESHLAITREPIARVQFVSTLNDTYRGLVYSLEVVDFSIRSKDPNSMGIVELGVLRGDTPKEHLKRLCLDSLISEFVLPLSSNRATVAYWMKEGFDGEFEPFMDSSYNLDGMIVDV